ncbi:MAG: BatD family protein, partial [Nitrososphaerales archaeon]
MSPLNFNTEVHVYFWKLVPSSYQGFASQFTEQQLETNDLAFYNLSYSAGTYSISIGGLKPLVSSAFSLYTQVGTSQNFTYSSLASSSSVAVHVLGGLISQSNSTFTNHYNNFSASMFEGSSGVRKVVPNLNATLDFSFPTIVAYRQIATLNPATNDNVTVTISIKNVSPSGSPPANDVSVNDTWVYNATAFKVTQGQTSGNQNLSAGQSMTIPYAFRVLPSAKGSYAIPPIPVTYSFSVGNRTVTNNVFMNTETLTINGTGPAIEAVESVGSGSVQSGQPISANITVTNKGGSTAFKLQGAGQTRASLLQGQTWNFIATSQSSLTQANSTLSYNVSWEDAANNTKTAETNTVSAVYSFATPSSPASSIFKTVSFFRNSNSANVTLTVLDNSIAAIFNLTVSDSLPGGMLFTKSYEPNSLRFSNGLVSANISSLASDANINFTYSLNITNINENYVFLPANVSSVWNNVAIVHFTQGIGLPLGVSASKEISPSAGFQGSSVSVQIGVTNHGTLPVYDAT